MKFFKWLRRKLKRRQPPPKIIRIERTDKPYNYRVWFDNGGSVIVRSASKPHYYEDI